MTVGERIKKRREELGMSQVELAKAIGEMKQTVYKYEAGVIKNIPLQKALEIARVLGVSIDELSGSGPGVLEAIAEDNELTEASELLRKIRLHDAMVGKEKAATENGDGWSLEDIEMLEAFKSAPDYKQSAIRDLLGLK